MVNENWATHGQPFLDFTEEITDQWKKAGGLGFSINVARDWLNIGLKKEDADYAYWLELNGYSPELVLNQGNDKDLRKKYKKFVKKQPKEKKPKVVHEPPRDPYNCETCAKHKFLSFKDWKRWHGERKKDLNEPWITVTIRPFRNTANYSNYTEYKEICGECKVSQRPHLNSCSWFKK